MGASTSTPSFPANDYELVLTSSKRLERELEVDYGAVGKGLHERITSVQDRLPQALQKRLRYIATIRNKLVHDVDCNKVPDRDGFIAAFERALSELNSLSPHRQSPPASSWPCVIC